MKKSAMEELIDGLDLTKIANRDKLVMVKYIIAKCLELEKEQIMDSFDYGYHCASNGTSAEITLDGKMHYNQTYNQNK